MICNLEMAVQFDQEALISRDGEVVSRLAHNQKNASANLAPATEENLLS